MRCAVGRLLDTVFRLRIIGALWEALQCAPCFAAISSDSPEGSEHAYCRQGWHRYALARESALVPSAYPGMVRQMSLRIVGTLNALWVTSGAVFAGLEVLGGVRSGKDIRSNRTLAAVGQVALLLAISRAVLRRYMT